MRQNKNIIILDSNIFIDFFCGGQQNAFALLPGQLFITSEVYEEIKEKHPYIDSIVSEGRLVILDAIDIESIEFQNIKSGLPSLSDADISSLLAAQKMGGLLLSGDRGVNKTAQEKHLPIRGTLWAVEELFLVGAFTVQDAKDFYRKCIEAKRRLPKKEIDKQLERFSRTER